MKRILFKISYDFSARPPYITEIWKYSGIFIRNAFMHSEYRNGYANRLNTNPPIALPAIANAPPMTLGIYINTGQILD
jgi:hypothetical protein